MQTEKSNDQAQTFVGCDDRRGAHRNLNLNLMGVGDFEPTSASPH
jgi:hypothetical protein